MNDPPTPLPLPRRKIGFRENVQKKIGFSGARILILVRLFQITCFGATKESSEASAVPQDRSGRFEIDTFSQFNLFWGSVSL